MGYQRFWLRFDGRINRARYLLATLAILCAMIALLVSLAVIGTLCGIGGRYSITLIVISASITVRGPAEAWWFPGIITLPLTVVFAWSYLAIAIKRLHDRNKSGWWVIPFVGLTALNAHFGNLLGDPPAFIDLVSGALFLWGLVEMSLVKGTSGPNRFGPDPLEPDDSSVQEAPRWEQHGALEFPVAGAGPWPGPRVKRGA
jgi:uncharacterized membrane protein YhaH (DUF805 family)